MLSKLLLLSVAVCFVAADEHGLPPNILLILADDLGWNDVSFRGSSFDTPNIDRFCRSGLTLDRYYTPSEGSPSRAAILSGMHPINLGMQHGSILPSEPRGLPLDTKIFPQILKEQNYKSYLVGKWDLGFFKKAYQPMNRGFDYHFGFWQSSQDYYVHTHFDQTTRYMGLDFHDGDLPVWRYGNNYTTDLLTDKAIELLQKHDPTRPFFLELSHLGVHPGAEYRRLAAPQRYKDRVANIIDEPMKEFAAMVLALDESLGRVMDKLRELDILNNTIVLFVSDNGGPANGMAGSASSNYPLRGGKQTLWEGGIRALACIKSELLNNANGKISNQLTFATDLVPTLMRAAGFTKNQIKQSKLDGYDLWNSLVRGKDSPRKEILYNIDPIDNAAAFTDGRYKLIYGKKLQGEYDMWYKPRGVITLATLRLWQDQPDANNFLRSQYKHPKKPMVLRCGAEPTDAITNCDLSKGVCLFDLWADPCEHNNLASTMQSKVEELTKRVEWYEERMKQPNNQPLDPNANPQKHGGVWTSWLDKEEPKTTAAPPVVTTTVYVPSSKPSPVSTMPTSQCFDVIQGVNCPHNVLEEIKTTLTDCQLECHSRGRSCRAFAWIAPNRCIMKVKTCDEPEPSPSVHLYYVKRQECI